MKYLIITDRLMAFDSVTHVSSDFILKYNPLIMMDGRPSLIIDRTNKQQYSFNPDRNAYQRQISINKMSRGWSAEKIKEVKTDRKIHNHPDYGTYLEISINVVNEISENKVYSESKFSYFSKEYLLKSRYFSFNSDVDYRVLTNNKFCLKEEYPLLFKRTSESKSDTINEVSVISEIVKMEEKEYSEDQILFIKSAIK